MFHSPVLALLNLKGALASVVITTVGLVFIWSVKGFSLLILVSFSAHQR